MRVHVIAPDGFDDPERPSGGNIYDRRICAGLAESGWDVRVTTVVGSWPTCRDDARADLTRIIASMPDGEVILVDGLIASTAAEQLLPHARRLRLIVLLHMPLATAIDRPHDAAARRSERAVLGAVAGVVVTSDWTRRQVIVRFSIPPDQVHVARPGVDRVHVARPGVDRVHVARPGVDRVHVARLGVDRDRAPLDAPGDRLLCVGAVAPHKGQDLLIEALGGLSDVDWHCKIVGSLDRDPRFVERLRDRIGRLGIGDRVQFTGMLTGRTLDRAYADAHLLVIPSRSETYGMVVTEALAHGIPVIGAAVGGVPEALGLTVDGMRPGRLVTPDDPVALGAALAEWLRDETHRRRLRCAAFRRRSTLAGWDQTVRDLQVALAGVQAQAQASLP